MTHTLKQTNEVIVNLSSSFAELIDQQTIYVCFYSFVQANQIKVKTGKKPIAIKCYENDGNGWLIHLREVYPFGSRCTIECAEFKLPVQLNLVTRSAYFKHRYSYDGFLGADYSEIQTCFFVWAPTAIKLTLNIFNHWYDFSYEMFPLSRKESGIWTITLPGNHEGKWYTYHVEHSSVCHYHIVDPNARFLSINGEKAMIGLLEKTAIPTVEVKKDLSPVIYEMHIRDFTSHFTSRVNNHGTFIGLVESKKYFLKLAKLGITHVQWLPIQDFTRLDETKREEQYNWGYDTTHFFGIEGSYSTNPFCGYARIVECKKAVQTIKQAGLRTVLDVVYNHFYNEGDAAVEKLVPGYFFRRWPNGELGNGTGVGNEFASEQPMARKLIIDSVKWWLDEFQFDGLRFDLMGSLDLETMKEIQAYTDKLERPILLYGEGWRLSSPLPESERATFLRQEELPEIGFFQDIFRDAIRGNSFSLTDKGFGCDEFEGIKSLQEGIYNQSNRSSQLIQYIEAHDNETLFDKLQASYPEENDRLIKRRHRLATSILLLAQGVPMLHAGQEKYRTKWGERDSYLSPDWVNQLKWGMRNESSYEAYISGLLQIRQAYNLSNNCEYFCWLAEDKQTIAYERHIQTGSVKKRIIVIHNASRSLWKLPFNYDGYLKNVVDDTHASLVPLYSAIGNQLTAKPLSTSVFVQNL